MRSLSLEKIFIIFRILFTSLFPSKLISVFIVDTPATFSKYPSILFCNDFIMLESLKDHSDYHKLQIYDMPDYINEILLPRLNIQKINEDIGIYNVCSLRNAKRVGAIEAIAKACTNGKVLEDQNTLCCGFAGNKGFSVPKLNISATYNIAKYFKEHNISRLYSSSSSCEVGLSDSMNKPWQHIAYLVDELSS